MLRSVAVLVLPGVSMFEFGVACEVFGIDRVDSGGPAFDFTVCAAESGVVAARHGVLMTIEHGLEATIDADLLIVPPNNRGPLPQAALTAIKAAADRGAWVMSECSGAFALAAAGVLAGRCCTTHWMHVDDLRAEVPDAIVDQDVLFVVDGNIITSAGTAAAIDAALHLVRLEHGAAAASVIARRMVVPPHRDGGQSQYIEAPIPPDATSLAPLLEWITANIGDELGIPELARRSAMSERTFARRFKAETGTTPAAWITRQRVIRAQELLERTDESVEQVASAVGFGSATVLRHHFARVLGTSPQAYRRTFSCVD